MAKGRDGGGKRPRGAPRHATVRVRTARGRRPSSTRWLQRQLNDPYVAEAQRRGYRSRAAFKLQQIDDRHHLLRPGLKVVDLGAAPGGWTQVAAARLKLGEAAGSRLVALDLQEMDPVPHVVHLTGDLRAPGMAEALREALGGPADVVLSDMAAPATGHAQTDHLRTLALVEEAYAFARTVLAPGGALVAKVLRGGTESTLLAALKRNFAKVRHVKPPASRAESAELYVVATGFRGGAGSEGRPSGQDHPEHG